MAFLKKLSVQVRRAMPQRLLRALRAGRLVASSGQVSPRMPAGLIEGCRFYASRFEMVRDLPKNAVVAEIGTDRGNFARHILDVAAPARLHIFDIDFGRLAAEVAADPRVTLHEGATPGTLSALAEASVDWIYVDGDHRYEGVAADASAAADKLKPGGYMVFNDFAHADPFLGRYGVHRAAMEFATSRKWQIVMFAYHPAALYDVALRKPG